MTSRLARTAVGLFAAILLTGCSLVDSGSSAKDAKTAEQVVTGLVGKVSTAKLTKTFTEEDDPNKLLGRPGQYTSKAAFDDSRVDAAQAPEGPETERGGGVEVFADGAAAEARKADIQKKIEAMGGLLKPEYGYVKGGVLVRVSGLLTPEQAKDYETALAAIS